MKIRTGFVSNSSSSSYMCEVTGNIESGMDMGLSDFEMSSCANGHYFYNDYLVECEDVDDEDSHEVSPERCPFCTFAMITNEDLAKLFFLLIPMEREEFLHGIKTKHTTYKKFKEYIDAKNSE